MKKRANKFGMALRDLIIDHGGKLPPDVVQYILSTELIAYSVAERPPAEGLNEMFEVITIAAGDQGFRLLFSDPGPHTVH